MTENERDFLNWLVWFVEHDQWDRERILALRDLLVNAAYGEHMCELVNRKRVEAYNEYIARIYAVKSWQEDQT